MRVGRHLVRPGKMRWRWTGFNFGLDLVLIIEKGQLTIQRLHRRLCKRVLSSQRTRTLIAGVSVTSIGANGKALFTQTSPIFITDLQKNDEMVLLNMDPKLVSPMLVSVKLLAVDPADQDFKQDTSSSGEAMIPNQHLVLGENPNESTSRSA
ncbi:hypothetical protein KR018_008115 [Drosophila ironensis]|nr:hypothetical protein KR018_008115 [Drosophila ironensis]